MAEQKESTKKIYAELIAPFPKEEEKTREQAGKTLVYLERQSYENRLDEVVGFENWACRYEFGPNGEIVCYLGIRDDGTNWIWKADGAGQTNIESIKGGLTDAFKRACARWGIGRYLYYGDSPPSTPKTPRPEPSDEGELALKKSKWKPGQIKTILENSYIVEEAHAIAFLDASGLKNSATQEAIKTFWKFYQAGRDENMEKADALQYAKDNWNK